jgi:hypothetical protein
MKLPFSQSQLLRIAGELFSDSQVVEDRKIAAQLKKVGEKLELESVLKERNPDDLVVENRFLSGRYRNRYRLRRKRR